MIVNNSTNIDKTKNHISLIEHKMKTTTYDVGNPGLDLEQLQIFGGVNGIPTLTF